MNLKVAHLVSVQFGIFVGVVSCLMFFRFESARPRASSERRKPATERAAAAEPVFEREDQPADTVDDGAEPERAEPVTEQRAPALPNEYSPEAVERYRALATKLYYEQIAPRRTVRSSPANSSIATVAPAYTEVVEEPAVAQTNEPAPETVAYIQPTEVIVYPQPAQFVVFSQPRRFFNRCRPAPRPGVLASNPHQRPNRGGIHLNGSPAFRPGTSREAAHHQNTGGLSCRSTQEFKPRGKR
jgi:hypothetical protein